jgi:hypothetical protein
MTNLIVDHHREPGCDLASQDVLIELVRTLEQQLWMVGAQLAPEER